MNAGKKKIDLYKKLVEYYKLAGVKRKPNLTSIMNLNHDLVEEQIRRVQEGIDDLRYFEPKRRREEKKDQLRQRIQEKERLREEHAHHIQDLEDRLMGRRNRRASHNIMEELKMRRTASRKIANKSYSMFSGNSQFLDVSLQALRHAEKAASPTDVEGWGMNLEALEGNKILEVSFAPEQKLCSWEMSERGDIAFNLVGKLYITFEPIVDRDTQILTRSKTVQLEHYPLDLDSYSSLMSHWEKAQSN